VAKTLVAIPFGRSNLVLAKKPTVDN